VSPPAHAKEITMKKAVFGLHVTGPTTLSVKAQAGTVKNDPVLTISTRKGKVQRLPGAGEWKVALEAGDHIVQLDGDFRSAIDIGVVPAAVFISLADSGSKDLVAWPGGGATKQDVKDPWPPPIVAEPNRPAAVASLAGADAASWFNTALTPMINAIGRGASQSPPSHALEPQSPPIHALVIGIDHYPPAPAGHATLFRDLSGCVRDALDVETFLRERLGVPVSRITRLLSPLPADPRGAKLPTYDNIVAAWQRLIDEVPAGAQIYIHYSGHGGRVKTCVPEVKGDAELDEALAPCDVNDRANGRFLRDVEIARLLDRMAERKHVGTIIVDGCHSGGITRGDAVPRTGERDDLEPRPSDARGSAVGTSAELAAAAQRMKAAAGQRSEGTRGIDAAWNVAPSSTVVVAACRPNEYAYEYAFDGVKRGALTYFWLQALGGRSGRFTYSAATRRIVADIPKHIPQQPMVFGDAEREVLGLAHVKPVRAIAVTAVNGDRITLAAGRSGFVRRGMLLAIAPPNAGADDVDELTGLPEVEVIEVSATSSIARRVGASAGPIVGGAQAIPLRYTESATRRVKCLPGGTPGDEDARRALTQALAADRSNLLKAVTDDETAHFIVTRVAAEGGPAYGINDATGRPIANLGPVITFADSRAAARVIERLAHLARFAVVQTLDNSDPSSLLTGCVEIELLALQGDYERGDKLDPRPFPGGQPERIPHNTWFCMRLRNRSAFEISVAVLDLQPDWGISKVVPQGTKWLQLAPDTHQDTAMRAWLPDGYGTSKDTLKAIATVQSTEWDWLCLDALDEAVRRGGTRRGVASGNLRAAMEAMRSATRTTRNVEAADVPTEAWTTVERTITIVAPDEQRDKGAA
jgi:hypothetical protein